MNIRLVVEKSEGIPTPQSMSLSSEETVVGRHRDCTLRIPCAEVSRRHCILRLRGNEVEIEDLGSLNGSYVNGQRVRGTQVLHPGDRLEVGSVTFALVAEPAVAAVCAAGNTGVAGEAPTVDLKPSDTGVMEAQPRVVAVEPVTEAAVKARPEALTKLAR